MRLRYRTIKVPPDTGRVTVRQVEQAVRALQQEEALKSSKSKLQQRGQSTGSRITKESRGKRSTSQ